MLQRDDETPSTPCARCPAPAECEIWDFAVCYSCASEWNTDPQFLSGAIDKATGRKPGVCTEDSCRKNIAEYERRTAAWVNAAKKTKGAA